MRQNVHPVVRRLAVVGALAMAPMGVVACGSDSDSGGAASSSSGGVTTVKIAHLADLSGATKDANEAMIRGMDLALEDPAIKQLLADRKVKLEIERTDTGGDPARALPAVQKVAQDKSIMLMLGPSNTPEFFASIPLAEKLKLPTYSFISGGVYPGKFNEWTWRTGFPDSTAIPPLVDDAKTRLQATTAGVLYTNDSDYGKFGGELYIKTAQAAGMQVTETSFSMKDTDFSAQVSKIKSANPDVVFIAALPMQVGFVIKALRDAGVKSQIMMTQNAVTPTTVIDNSKGAAEGSIVSAAFDASSTRPNVQAYVKAFKAKYPDQQIAYDPYAFDAIHVIADTLSRIKGEITRDSVREALGQTDIEALTAEKLYFPDKFGDAVRRGVSVLKLVKPGQLVPQGS